MRRQKSKEDEAETQKGTMKGRMSEHQVTTPVVFLDFDGTITRHDVVGGYLNRDGLAAVAEALKEEP